MAVSLNKKVHITTLGCSKNVVDSEILMGQLNANSFDVIESPENSDVIIVNTCGFIQSAKEESIQAILEALELKERDPAKKVFVAGCLSQRYKPEIEKEMPGVDAIFGTEDYQSILKALGKKHSAVDNLHRLRMVSTPRHFAYLKISEGCNHSCAFCAIPHIRGKHRSRSIESLVEESKKLAENGAKELILVSQDTSHYGKDLYGKQSIVNLLQQLEKVDGIEWIRVLYWYPTNFPKDVIQLMKGSSKILPYIDMPIQHISENMLRTMRRGDTRQSLDGLFEMFREEIPHITLRTTFILGHPGETDKDFDELTNYIRKIRFDRVGTFVYSDEENTYAFDQKNKVDEELANQRQAEFMEIQKDISFDLNEQYIGKKLKVLIDDFDINTFTYYGRTFRDAPEIDNEVIIQSDESVNIKPGDFADVIIDDAAEYELFGSFEVKTEKSIA
ncbi:MAG: 30S ribosomal protein S12 methylthiotransferase RimO [Calditrichaeota bacterium]|nr:MAG: 30S ribosomal protein S12 methylthiotransferase RimO [Calditrichota bacterium]MBL1204459.1 30S ribosomal protein S12 methylthiotransferase RimO [Calditrichota bacterium]NOG44288.1 30S ribosomal protein S12 methylthiotransferase RimO [Calditrichota bacterium]